MKKVATTIRIDNNLIKEAKKLAAKREISMNDIFTLGLILILNEKDPKEDEHLFNQIGGRFVMDSKYTSKDILKEIKKYKNGGYLKR